MKHAIIGIFVLIMSVSALGSEGVISIESRYTVSETADRFIKIIDKKGLTLFNRINHQKNAQNSGLTLRDTEVIIFGNPKIGTPLMHCAQTVAIDLPQKVLIHKDENNKVFVSYNNPEYLKSRHAIEGCDQIINKISNVLAKLTQIAAQDSNNHTQSE